MIRISSNRNGTFQVRPQAHEAAANAAARSLARRIPGAHQVRTAYQGSNNGRGQYGYTAVARNGAVLLEGYFIVEG